MDYLSISEKPWLTSGRMGAGLRGLARTTLEFSEQLLLVHANGVEQRHLHLGLCCHWRPHGQQSASHPRVLRHPQLRVRRLRVLFRQLASGVIGQHVTAIAALASLRVLACGPILAAQLLLHVLELTRL